MFIVDTLPTRVLFDAGAAHSFINPKTVKRIACPLNEMDIQLCVTTPVGSMHKIELVIRNCPVTIQKRIFPANLIQLGIQEYDVILGKDSLTKYQATIDCKQKTLVLITPERENLVYKRSYPRHTIPLISTTKACKLKKKGCLTFLCAVEVIGTHGLEPKYIPVVQEFLEVFQEVPGLPSDGRLILQ